MKKITFFLICLLTQVGVKAQWNTDTAINTLVASSETQDSQSITSTNGETFIAFWKEIASTNYELRLQKLDAAGNQLLGTEGVLVSNTIPMGSYTSVWSLTRDASNNVYIGVTGTSGNGGYAFKLDSNGVNLWGSTGISLGTGFLVRIFPTDTGEVLVSWFTGNAYIQKYSADGVALWTTPKDLGSSKAVANIYTISASRSVVIYHQLASGINSVLYALSLSSEGNELWTAPVQLFDNINKTAYNALYYGVQDGDVIYYSYKLAHNNRFDSYVQRINADGTLPWGLTGKDFDINQTNYEQETQIAFSPGSQYVWALCRYTNSSQGNIGVYVQKFDKTTGERQFTDNAKEVFPISATAISPAGNFRLYNDTPIFLAVNGTSLNLTLLDSNGNFALPQQTIPFATYAATKSRIQFNQFGDNDFVATFNENKGSGDKIYAQSIRNLNSLATENINFENTKLIYTNPVNTNLKLNANTTIQSVSIYNNLGQLINQAMNIQSNEANISAENWQDGVYFVTVTTINGTQKSIKIVKQ